MFSASYLAMFGCMSLYAEVMALLHSSVLEWFYVLLNSLLTIQFN
jgi:hypothetical protein